MPLKDYLDKAANVGMGILETGNAPFEAIGESIRGAGESEPLKMASASDPSGFRWPSIVQRLAPSTRTPEPPADPFMKAYQGLEGLTNLPRGTQAASDVVTGQPDIAAQIGGVGLGFGLMPPVVKGMANAEMPKALANERGAISLGKKEPYFPPGSPERQAAFDEWFGGSKTVDPEGKAVTVYHGSQRPDRIGEVFKPGRATSGPMAFFTEDPEIASGYAKGKKDTSLDDVTDYAQWFKGRVQGLRNPVDVDRLWHFLTPEKRREIAELAPRITTDPETGQNIHLAPAGHTRGLGGYDQHIKEAQGNHLKALVEEWLNSGELFNDESEFEKVLKLAGVDNVEMHDPHAEYSGVFPANLSIKNPLDTSQIPPDVVTALEQAAKYKRGSRQTIGADPWDKSIRNPKEWVKALKEDIAKGTTHAWTSIPDFVTDTLKQKGYDGIKDTGGKYHPDQHNVWVPFESTQVKSATGNRGTFNPKDPNITHAVPLAVGAGAGVAAQADAEEPQYAEGGIVEEEPDMPFESEAQRKYLYANQPDIAEQFEAETPEDANLPKRAQEMNQGGMAGNWKDDVANYMSQRYGGEPDQMQHLAGGGFAGDFDVDMGDTSTARGIPYAPPETPAPMPSLPETAPGPVFNPKAGLPPAPPPVAPAIAPAASVASSGPDPLLQDYLAQQKAALNRYGPEQQMAFEQSLQKQRSGVVPVLANAATGFADAIMQGVARAGPSNFQSNLQNRLDKSQEGQREAFKNAQTGHMAKMKQEMEFAQIDPESPLSRLAQRSAMPLLRELGLSDDEIRNIPASLIGEAQTKRLTLEEIRTKAEEVRALREQNASLTGATLDLKRDEAKATRRREALEQGEKVQQRRLGAAKDLLTKSGNARVLGIPIPFTSDVSSKDKKAALEVMREGMHAGPAFDTEEDAEAAGLPVGTEITIGGRPARVK